MSRTKGALNRSTLERIIRDRGYQGDLSSMTREQLQYKVANPEPVFQQAPVVVETTPQVVANVIPASVAQGVIDDARRRFQLMVDYYTWNRDTDKGGERAFVPERIQEYLRTKVYSATSLEGAYFHAKKALDKLYSHLMALWEAKYISGPATVENIEKVAKKAEAWAKKLEADGKDASEQWKKVERIRATPTRSSGSPWNY